MNTSQAVETLAALAHEHRLRIYRLLIEAGPAGLNAGTIALRLKLLPSSLTFHVQHLHRAGLVTQERNSRQLIYAADFGVMNSLVGYLTENCCASSSCAPAAESPRPAGRRRPRASRAA